MTLRQAKKPLICNQSSDLYCSLTLKPLKNTTRSNLAFNKKKIAYFTSRPVFMIMNYLQLQLSKIVMTNKKLTSHSKCQAQHISNTGLYIPYWSLFCCTLTEQQQHPLLLLNVAGVEAVFNFKAVLDCLERQRIYSPNRLLMIFQYLFLTKCSTDVWCFSFFFFLNFSCTSLTEPKSQ